MEYRTKNGTFLIDEEDIPIVSKRNWYLVESKNTEYVRSTDSERILLHRLLMGVPAGVMVDHRNGNGRDNRRFNLRIATPQQQSANRAKYAIGSSKYKGVTYRKARPTKPWVARIRVDDKLIHLGQFYNEEDAAKAYDAAAKKYFGEFAYTNF